jgi:hypothetical protein
MTTKQTRVTLAPLVLPRNYCTHRRLEYSKQVCSTISLGAILNLWFHKLACPVDCQS